jgi:hypothetical protein
VLIYPINKRRHNSIRLGWHENQEFNIHYRKKEILLIHRAQQKHKDKIVDFYWFFFLTLSQNSIFNFCLFFVRRRNKFMQIIFNYGIVFFFFYVTLWCVNYYLGFCNEINWIWIYTARKLQAIAKIIILKFL